MTPITKSIRELTKETSEIFDILEAGAASGVIVTRRGRPTAVLLPATSERLMTTRYSPASGDYSVSSSKLKHFGVAKYVREIEETGGSLVVTRQNRPVAVLAPGSRIDELVGVTVPVATGETGNTEVVDNETPLPPPAVSAASDSTEPDPAIHVGVVPTEAGTWRRSGFVVPPATFDSREEALTNAIDIARRLELDIDVEQSTGSDSTALAT